MADKKAQKNAQFNCEKCNFHTNNKTDYSRHILRPKHLRLTSCINNVIQEACVCICGAAYKHRQSLCKHKKVCETHKNKPHIQFDKDTIIMELLKQNIELQKQLIELSSILP